MFRWGILSTAKIAREQVIPGILEARNGRLEAIASLSPDRARFAAAQFGIPTVFDSYDALLASADVDGVYIPIPTAHHTEWAIKAAEAGKHVLCEKPIAMRAEDIDRIIAARDQAGVTVAEAFMVAYHPQWAKVRALIAEGAIGALRHIEGSFTYHNTNAASTRNSKDLGGGGLPDIGVYPVITARLATGQEPKRLRGQVEYDPEFGTDWYANATLEFDGFTMTMYCGTRLALRQRMVFHGETGVIEVLAPFNAGDYGLAEVVLHTPDRGQSETFRFGGVRQYRNEVEAFADAATGQDADLFTLEDSRANQVVIDAIFEAGRTDGWVTV